jgi:DNA-binding transcriptional ArsR family regulator
MNALGDATRRAVLDRLRRGPLSVGDLAASMPVSRPAVSQHLRVLKEAGLVIDRQEGNRRIYSLDADGLSDLRRYFERLWDDVLLDFKNEVEKPRRRRSR